MIHMIGMTSIHSVAQIGFHIDMSASGTRPENCVLLSLFLDKIFDIASKVDFAIFTILSHIQMNIFGDVVERTAIEALNCYVLHVTSGNQIKELYLHYFCVILL